MKVTKETILEALRMEPLYPGTFLSQGKSPEECTVCAIGAVLRHLTGTPELVTRFASVCAILTGADCVFLPSHLDDGHQDYKELVEHLIEHEEYWSALSVFFEGYYEEVDDKTVEVAGIVHIIAPRWRRKIYNFVETNFPDELEISDDLIKRLT